MSEETPPSESRGLVSEGELRTLAGFLFTLIEAQITRADTKAGLVIAADSVFSTGALFQARHGAILLLFDNTAPWSVRLVGAFMILMFGALFLSMMYGLLAARPSLRVRGDSDSLLFFSRIARFSHPEFRDAFSKLTLADFHSSLMNEVYTTAQIANEKFVRIRRSIDFLIVAVVLWAVVQLVLALSL